MQKYTTIVYTVVSLHNKRQNNEKMKGINYKATAEYIKRNVTPSQVIQNAGLTLVRHGGLYQACCPFHEEKTASFKVSDAKNQIHCFGCGWSNTSIDFVMEYCGLEFTEAVLQIAKDNNITPIEGDEEISVNKNLAINEQVAMAYQRAIITENVDYVKEKALTKDDLRKWRIGFAPKQAKFIQSLSLGDMYNSLVTESGYDRFIYRLIIPLIDQRGNVLGFAGRTLLDSETQKIKGTAKWINSPESSTYNKSNYLFGLDKAIKEIRKRGFAIVVEGYLDCIQMHKIGFENTVCVGSATVTDAQAKALSRITDTAYTFFDGDSAGLKGTCASISTLYNNGISKVFTMLLINNEDPDDATIRYGKDGIAMLINNANNALSYVFQSYKKSSDVENAKAVCLNIVSKVKPLDKKNDLAITLADNLGYNSAHVRAEFINKVVGSKPQNKKQQMPHNDDVAESVDDIIIRYLLCYGDILIKKGQLCGIPIGVYLADTVEVTNVQMNAMNKKIFDCIYRNLTEMKGCNVDGHQLTKEEQDYVNAQLFRDIDYTKQAYIEDLVTGFVKNLKVRQLMLDVQYIGKQISSTDNKQEKSALVAKLNNLTK